LTVDRKSDSDRQRLMGGFVAGQIFFAAVGDDLIAVERIGHSRHNSIATRLAEHRRRLGTARLIWATPAPLRTSLSCIRPSGNTGYAIRTSSR
jgi:hypothetical protein